ncbi:DNA repair protein [Acanthamoeba castellanii str. Neff]|uniref:DNA repair protein n=1 Tax=Acanthamoeba castellanii (strain ATCC 30010 / Neff) TaxID=1257118 RepID=L8HJY0_ACACF|nr:DNA repair protein [Acanthamoeba castellanii str. Neff]ELR25515.1 DNA repair protein [Acanthamoeba castellanii str. Neff]
MELDEYMQLTKRALTVQDITKKHFSYRLSQPSPSELHLTWRIKLGQESSQVGFSVKGTLPLTLMKDGRGMVQQCLDSLIDRQTVLERSNKELRTQNEALFTQRDSALAQLNVLVEEKKAMESDLYNKILNEKKKKIRELKRQGKAFPRRSGVVSLSDEEDSRWPPSTAGSTRNANTAQERRTSGPEDDADEETSHKGTPLRKKAFLDDALILTSMTTTQSARVGDAAQQNAAASTSFKEKLMAQHSPLVGSRKRPNSSNNDGDGDDGVDQMQARFAKPVAKKVRLGDGQPGSPRKPQQAPLSSAAARAAKRRSVSAEDLLDMCQ